MRSALLLLLLALHACTFASAFSTCKHLSSCNECVAARGCGWSGDFDAGECVSGSKLGAAAGERLSDVKRVWNYGTCRAASLPSVHVYERRLNFSTGSCCEFDSCKDVGRGCCLGNVNLPCTVDTLTFNFNDPLPATSSGFSYVELEYNVPSFVQCAAICREMYAAKSWTAVFNGNELDGISELADCFECISFGSDQYVRAVGYVLGGKNTFQLVSKPPNATVASFCGPTVELVIRAYDASSAQPSQTTKREDAQRCAKFTRRGCHQCTMQSTCGWDSKTKQCVAGDEDGPEGNSRYTAPSDWFFSSCPKVIGVDHVSASNADPVKQFVINFNLPSCCKDSPFCCIGNPSYTGCSMMATNVTFDDPLPPNYTVDRIVFYVNGTLTCDQNCNEFFAGTDLQFYVNNYLGSATDESAECGANFDIEAAIKPENYYKYGSKNTATITRMYRFDSGVSKFCPVLTPTLTIFAVVK